MTLNSLDLDGYWMADYSEVFAPFKQPDRLTRATDFDIDYNAYRIILEWRWSHSELGYLRARFARDDLLDLPAHLRELFFIDTFKRMWRRTRFVEPEPHIILGEN